MKKLFQAFGRKKEDDDLLEMEEEYVELDSTQPHSDSGSKIIVRPFTIEDFSDVKEILDAIRNSDTIALVNIRPLKQKDMIELKRAINKLKKTCDAIKGEIAGFGDDYIVVAPEFATIYRQQGPMNDEL